MQAIDRLADTTRWLRYAEEDWVTAEILLMPEATNVDASEAVEQARTIWTSVSTALAEHGYRVGQDL